MALYDAEYTRSYFDAYGQSEWERWDRSRVERVKLAMHNRILEDYLPSGGRILEMGAGAGRFTGLLVDVAETVVVADISPVQLDLNRTNARKQGIDTNIEAWVECDMCDLDGTFTDRSFDAVVCIGGPLSYVFEHRERALGELRRVTKDGGVIVLGVMSLWGTIHHFLPDVLKIDPVLNRRITTTGDLGPAEENVSSHRNHMFTSGELLDLISSAKLQLVNIFASDCLSAVWQDQLEELEEGSPPWEHLIELEYAACQNRGSVDMGTHMIAVCRRV